MLKRFPTYVSGTGTMGLLTKIELCTTTTSLFALLFLSFFEYRLDFGQTNSDNETCIAGMTGTGDKESSASAQGRLTYAMHPSFCRPQESFLLTLQKCQSPLLGQQAEILQKNSRISRKACFFFLQHSRTFSPDTIFPEIGVAFLSER